MTSICGRRQKRGLKQQFMVDKFLCRSDFYKINLKAPNTSTFAFLLIQFLKPNLHRNVNFFMLLTGGRDDGEGRADGSDLSHT